MDTSDREPGPLKDTLPPEEAPQAPRVIVRPIGWEWGREADRGPRIPWIGLFIFIWGILLLVQQLAPDYFVATNLAVLAAGLAFLIIWMLRRGTFPLYAGAFLTASTIPGLVRSAGYDLGSGVEAVAYGAALLFIALVRMTRDGGVGWQALIGVLLVALGGAELAAPEATDILLPLLLVVFGLVLISRERPAIRFGRPRWRGRGREGEEQ